MSYKAVQPLRQRAQRIQVSDGLLSPVKALRLHVLFIIKSKGKCGAKTKTNSNPAQRMYDSSSPGRDVRYGGQEIVVLAGWNSWR